MLFSVKFHTMDFVGFFDCEKPAERVVWRYVLLFAVKCSHIAHILKNEWSYLRPLKDYILSGKGFRWDLTTKNQHEVIRVIAITNV
ncbi:hypothetical protein ASV28_21325 [Enterobacter cloacae subsp. cloacae]|nr:hypothetical protein ASV28_21325 [Enterobacter cloacae subsp. cloacae]